MRKLSTPLLIAGKEVKQWSFKTALTLFMVMLTTLAFSQINYTRTTFTGAYVPITVGGGATQISTVGTGLGDFTTTLGVANGLEGAAHILLPFNFNYNGTNFGVGVDFIGINTNGLVYPIVAATGGLNTGKITSNINTNLFTVTAPNNCIAPYWDDLTIGTAVNGNTGTVLYQTTGIAGSQVLTIQYTNVPAFSAGNVKALNFQVLIYETTNVIEFVYGPMTNGTALGQYNVAETATIGIEGGAGGNTNYIDAITGSKTANMSMMNSNKFTSLLNMRFTPGAPAAVAGGTYNVGVGQTYPSLSEAVADLNHRGVAGAVTLNLTDAVYDTTVAGGKNIFPIVVSNITGTSLLNTILINHTGAHADLRYRGTDQGNIGNQASTTIIGTTFEPMFCLVGTDFLTVNNLDFTYNGVQGVNVSYQTTSGKVDNSIGVINSSSTDGATNNTFSNFVCTGDRTCTGGGQAIRHVTQTAPASAAGANGGNTYRDFVIKNGTSGFLISGTAGFPDINNRIITSSCNTYNIIGDPAVADDMSNPNAATGPFGITMANQSGFTVSNNKITNMTSLNTTAILIDAINITLFQGTNQVSNNIISNIRQNGGASTVQVSGIKMTNATTLVNEIRVFNNSVSGLSSAYAGAATVTRVLLGIHSVSTLNTTSAYSIYNNSVSIDGSGSINGSNSCFQVAGTTGPRFDVRNNIFANYTAAQVGLNVRHNCYNTNSSTLLGGTGTTVNQNDMYVANDAGVSGFIGWNTLGLVGFNPVATFDATYATQVTAANLSGDPIFFNNNGNLHATNSALLAGAGSAIPVYITTDLDCNPRVLPQHIGAYLSAACVSGIPTVSVSPAGLPCSQQALNGTTSAITPVYQWNLNGSPIFGANSASYTPLVAGSYTLTVNNAGENCFGVSTAVVVSQSPSVTIAPTSASICDGQSVTITSVSGGGAYGLSNATTTADEEILGVTVGALNNPSICGAVAPGPGSLAFQYSNYTSGVGAPAAPSLNAGASIAFSINIGTCGGIFTSGCSIFIDYNQNGVWENPAERVAGTAVGTNGPYIFAGNFTVPATAKDGITRMRVINVEGGTSATIVPVGTYGFGETEDYNVNIVNPLFYSWSPSTGVSSTTILTPTITPVIGTTVYTLTVTDGVGCTSSNTVSITNLGAGDPNPTTTGASICAGATGILSASGLSTLNWYTLPVGGTLVNTGPTYTLAFPATTTFYVESFNGTCPSGRTPVTVTVTALPSTTPTAVPSAICFGGTSQLDAGTFLSGSLTTGLLAGNGASGNAFNVVATNTVTLTGFSITATTAAQAQVWYLPGGFAGPTLNSSAGWILAGTGNVAIGTNSPITGLVTSITIPAGQTYGIVVVSAGSVSYTNGTLFGNPNVNDANIAIREGCGGAGFGGAFAFGNTPRNFNGTIIYSFGDPNLGFAWSPAGDLNSATIKSPIATPPAAGANPYTVTVTNAGGCTNSATVTVSVVAPPLAPTASVVSVPCGNGNAVLSATALGGGTLKWYANASGGSALAPNGSPRTFTIGSDTTFYVSETTLASPFCEGPRTAVFVDIVDPDTIAATVDIPLICNQGPGAIQVNLSVANVSVPQLNQYFYTWTASGAGGLNSSTGTAVTANPTATTTYTVTANQIGNLTVNINGVSPNGPTNQDEITWTLKDASNVTILSGGPYVGFSNNVTSLPVLSNNGPFTFQITAGTAFNDSNFTNFTVFCEANVIASGCVKGALNVNETACLNIGTVTVPNINGCFGSCNRIATVLVGVGTSPTFNTLTAANPIICQGSATAITANASVGGPSSFTFTGGGITINDATSASPYPSNILVSGLAVNASVANVKINGLTHTFPSDIDICLVSPTGVRVTMCSDQGGGSGIAGVNLTLQDGSPVIPGAISSGTYRPTNDAGTDTYNAPFPGGSIADANPLLSSFIGDPNGTWSMYIMDDVGGDLGSLSDWSITFTGVAIPVTYSWSPATGLSATTGASVTATPPAVGTITYTVTASDPAGCTTTASIDILVNVTPPAPAVTGDAVCGPDTVNLSAALSDLANSIIWTDTIGGQILASGTNYNPYVTKSGSFYVHEVPPTTATTLNNNLGGSAGFFPDGASFMNFTVSALGGIVINTVDVSTNAPVANAPLVVALVNQTTGQIVSVHDTIYLTAGGNTALQTISLNMYVPAGNWRLQPILNPNLNVSNSSTLPASLPGQITVTCFGNVSNACFPINFNGLFYNWNVSTACISPAAIVNYVVNTSPALGIASSNGLAFCDSVNTVLTAVDSTLSGYDVFEWSPATGLSATTGSSVTVTNLLTTTTYSLTAHNTVSGCNAIATFVANVNPSPSLILSYHDTTICPLAVPVLPFNSTAAKSSVVPVGNRFDPNFVVGTVFGGNTTQYSQLIFTAAELNAAGLVGPTNITSIAYFVSNKLTTTTYVVDISMRSDVSIPAAFPSTTHINTLLTPVYNNPSIASNLGWNTFVFTTPFLWDGVSNVLVSQCFTHNVPGFFDVVSTSPTSGVRYNALNASACAAATGAFIPAPNQNDRPDVRFTGGNVLFSWSPALGLSSATAEDPTLTTAVLVNNVPTDYVLTVTDPLSGCSKSDTITVTSSTTPLAPIVNYISDSIFCVTGNANMRVSGTTGDFQWQSSPDGINFTDISGATNDTLLQTVLTTTYFRVDVSCTADSINSEILTFVVNSPGIISTVGDTICGVGQVCLSAVKNDSTYFVQWFNDSTGGNVIANGDSFCTVISATDTFWVQATVDTNSLSASGNVFYMRGSGGEPWGSATNVTALNAVYGPQGTAWNLVDYLAAVPANIFNTSTKIVFMEGSDASITQFQTFYAANLTLIQNWVSGGGHLFVNAGPNGGPTTVALGFGGVTLNNSVFTPTATIAAGYTGHPIFNTPLSGLGNTWTGGSYGHATISGGAAIKLIDGLGGASVLSVLDFGNGRVLFGGMTMTNFHSPLPQADNLRRNMFSFLNTGFNSCNSTPRIPVVALSTPPPAMALTGSSLTLCELTCTNLDVDLAGQANYSSFEWSPAAGLSATTGASVVACPLVTTTYIVSAFNLDGCANTDTVVITVTPAPLITSLTSTPNPVCGGDSAQIEIAVTPFIPPTGQYSVTSIPFAPVTPTGTPVVLQNAGTLVTALTSGSADDGTWQNIPLPAGFAFNYYGTVPTAMSVSTNGFLTFTANSALSGCCSGQVLPNAGTPNDVIAYGWEDWNQTAGTTDYFTNGVAPFRKFVLRSQGVPRFGGTGAPSTVMVILNETFNTVEIQIASIVCGGGDATTLGIENATGTLGTAVAGRNSVVGWTATNEGWLFAPPVSSGINYAWSPATGLSSTSISNPKAAPTVSTQYTVTITETGTGCSRTDSLLINTFPTPKPYIISQVAGNILGDTTLCTSDALLIEVKDSGAYAGGYPAGTTYELVGYFPADTANTFLITSGDIYVVKVKLPFVPYGGCEALTGGSNISFTVEPPQITMSLDSVACFGTATGNVIATITFSGTPNYHWIWTDSIGNVLQDQITSDSINILYNVGYGIYNVSVLDHIGAGSPPFCLGTASDTLREPSGPLYVLEELANHIDVQCYGSATGAIDITTTGGTSPYTYFWSNGSTDEDQTGLVVGIYTCTATDSRGCTYEISIEITENPEITVGTAQSNVSCHSGFDGTATVFVSGGIPGYTYLWDDGQTDATAFDLPAGLHTVVVTDASGNPGCDTTITFLITEPVLLDATTNVINLNCFGSTNGVATVFPFGGNPPYSYSWNSIPAQTTQTATGLPFGSYTCIIIDSTGCEKDVVIEITQPDSLYLNISVDDVNCYGGNDGSITVSVVGGNPGYTYLWDDSQTTATATGLAGGTHVVTVTDNLGCEVIQSILVNEPLPITAVVSCLNNATCYGAANGTACVNVTGGTPGYSYLWNTSPGNTTSSVSGLAAGTYSVIITDAAGCTSIETVTITQPDAIALNPDVEQPLCGNGIGSIELSITGGVMPYSIIWSNGNTTQVNGGLVAGTYTVTVTDLNNCVTTQIFTLTAPAPIVVTPAITNVGCNGAANGAITLNVSGGAGGYTYIWNNGDVTSTITGLIAGNYTVTVYDANSCSITQTITVTEPALLTCVCSANVVNVSCFGGSNGSITALPLGGTAPYSYSWVRISPIPSGVLATTQTISGLTAGTYEVTITDANGCVKVGNTTITQPNQLLAVASVINSTCNGGSNGKITVSVFGGTPPYSYLWNTTPPQTTSIAIGLGAGTYTCIITDAHGCSTTVTGTITQPAAIVLTTSKNNVSCNGGLNGTASVSVTGGAAPYSYLWSNGKTTANITGLAANTYTVIVTDALGCTNSASVNVTQPTKISVLYVATNPSCNGASNGAISLTVTGGTSPYTYIWSNGATTASLTGLTAGVYNVTVKDKKGCVISAVITLIQPNAIVLSTTIKNVKCFGGNTGKLTVSATGGTSPYFYLWSNGATTASANNLTAGTYSVIVTDKKGCSNTISATVTQSPLLVCSANVACMNNVTCFGGSNGKLCVTATGGLAPYKYLWNTSPVATTASVNNVPAGTYTVTITDKNGCTTSCTFTITQPSAAVAALVSGTNVNCYGGTNGTASVVASGGTSPYTYLWNTGAAATTDNVSDLSAGTYTVTVTDVNGCTGSGSITITQNSALSITETHTSILCNGGLGSITALAAGGFGPYSYSLNPAVGIPDGLGGFTGLPAGSYDVTATDEAGCSVTITGIVITEPTALTMDAASGTDVSCNGGNNGTATAGVIAGGTAPYTYNWNSIPPQGTATATGLSVGTYQVTVTDVNGCTVSSEVTIFEPQSPLTIAVIAQTNISCNGGVSGEATVEANGGTPGYDYLWNDGQTTATATGLPAGTIAVTVTDANGCQATTTVNIAQPNAFIVNATATNVLCNGTTTGTITAVTSGGNSPFLFVLGIDTNSTGVFINLSAGTYTVTAIDGGGCTASTSVSLTEPSALIANTTSSDVSCFAGSNGFAAVYPAGGVPPYTYNWTSGSVAQNATGLIAGSYLVTVTDASGCTIEKSVTIAEPAAIAIAQTQVNNICNSAAAGSATATVTGGTAPYFYFWSNGQMTPTATGLVSNIYTVTVTDYNGCSVTATYDITEPTSLLVDTNVINPTCFGGLGTAEIIVVGGQPGYSYVWSNGATTSTVTVPAGTYYVTATDANGCSITQCVIVVEPSQVICAASATDVTCNGLNNGTATAVGSGGTGVYSYLWTDSQTTATAIGLAPGNYSVFVTDENGCTSICSVTVNEPDAINLSLSTSNTSCGADNGSASATVSGGVQPYTYEWSTTETSQSINNLPVGTYTVTVTDANGCGPVSASVTISSNDPVSCSTTGTNPTCTGYLDGTATVSAVGGNGSYSVQWNTSPIQYTLTATGLAAGIYEVTVTDISGCSSTCSIEIEDPSPLVLTASQSNNACNGGSSGVATVSAFGGTPYTVGDAYTYSWSNGQTTATITGLTAGSYYVTVTDSAGCQATLCVIMQQANQMICNTSTTPASCGQSNGSAIVNVLGGQGPYSYFWGTVPVQTNAIATLLPAGTYTVVVTDANGCTTQCTATVFQPGAISFGFNIDNAACNGGFGLITINALNGGAAPYTYLWSNNSTTDSSGPVLAGTYTVVVTDANGCTASLSGTVTEPSAIVLSTTQTDVSCNGNVNGSACVSVTGGTQPYTYSWSTGANSNCISNLIAGSYDVTVTDSKGCILSTTIVIAQPAVLDTLSSSATASSCGLNNGTATVDPTGGTPLYSYSWNTIPVQTTQTATGLAGGNNFVTITDANGCSITVCVKVPSSTGIALTLASPVYAGGYNIRCNGGSDGAINLTVSGTGPFIYTWSNSASTEDQFGLTAGTYTVEVTNGGCTSTASITLTQAPAWTVTTSQLNVTCKGASSGTATVNVLGGTAPYSYSWTTAPVQTTKTATGLKAGIYTVTVSDANGCTQTAVVNITEPATGLSITATSINPSCNGTSDGSIDITVTGGVPPYTYLWTGGTTTEDRSGIAAGSHTVTVFDASGCTIQLCVVLVQPTQLAVTTSKTDVGCAGGNNGSASAIAAGGTPGYSYLWNTGATTNSISNLPAGNYTVTVTDSKGCIRNANVIIAAPAAMILSTTSTNVTVYGGNNGTASVTVVSGGTAPYAYSWNTIPVKTTASVSGLTAATYQVTVIDNKGCVKVASVVITQPNYLCSSGTPFRTETPSRWGASSGTANTYLTANFSAAFPAGLVVGGGCGGSKTLTLSNSTAVRNYEVNQATSGSGTVLSANLTNPTSVTFPSALAANCVALTLNVTFDVYDPNFAPVPTTPLGNMIYTASPFTGLTVNQILSEGNKKLGGCSSGYTVSQLNTAIQNIDSAYKAGITGPTAALLACPGAKVDGSGLAQRITDITAYPNPSNGVMNLRFEALNEGNLVIHLMDVTGRSVWNIEENVFIGDNIRTYDFSQLRKGVYMMMVTKDDKTEIIRIILQ